MTFNAPVVKKIFIAEGRYDMIFLYQILFKYVKKCRDYGFNLTL